MVTKKSIIFYKRDHYGLSGFFRQNFKSNLRKTKMDKNNCPKWKNAK